MRRTPAEALAALSRLLDQETAAHRGDRTERECVLDTRLRKILASVSPAELPPDLWHRPIPGPLYWDWRCMICSEAVADHPGVLARVRHALAEHRAARRGE